MGTGSSCIQSPWRSLQPRRPGQQLLAGRHQSEFSQKMGRLTWARAGKEAFCLCQRRGGGEPQGVSSRTTLNAGLVFRFGRSSSAQWKETCIDSGTQCTVSLVSPSEQVFALPPQLSDIVQVLSQVQTQGFCLQNVRQHT